MRFVAASPHISRAAASAPARGAPASTAEFNAAWGVTEPAALDDGRTPAAFEPAPVHGWAVTMPAVLENPPRRQQVRTQASPATPAWGATLPTALEGAIEAQPFREAMDGLAVREVHEPALFQVFFGTKSPTEWMLEPMR